MTVVCDCTLLSRRQRRRRHSYSIAVEWDRDQKRSSASGWALNRHPSAEGLRSVFEPDKSRPLGKIGAPESVVANREIEFVIPGICAHFHLGGAGMFGRVGQRLGHYVVGTNFE
jgi:hypothetical protein